MHKLVVIVPVYNVRDYLKRCIESVLNQSFKDFKLLLVDDGSTDTSGDLCDEYALRDGRIEVIHQENMGLSEARNRGINASSEKYIMFLDSDDFIHKDTLKLLYENLKAQGADISVVGHRKIYKNEEIKKERLENNISVLDNKSAVELIVEKSNSNMIVAWGKLYDRSLFKNIRYPKEKYHEDEFVTYKILYKARRVVVSDAKVYYYLQRDNSITGDRYSLKRLEKLEGLRDAISFFENLCEYKLASYALYRYLLNLQIAYYRVKFELKEESRVLYDLKRDYDKFYIEFRKIKDFSIIKKTNLTFFYHTPDVYSVLVRVYILMTHIFFKDK